jgi:anti-sigma regulatory factor (Ser/Thr protein kinase)
MSTRHFDYAPESVSEARRHVRQVLQAQPRDVVDVAELLTSELVTNAIRHGASGFELTITVEQNIRVEVRDEGAGRPSVVSAGPQDPSGRGLGIVEALSSAWGVIDAADGKTVWYELSLAPRQQSSVSSVSAEQPTDRVSGPAPPRSPRSSSRGRTRRGVSGKPANRGAGARALAATRTS